MEFLYSKFGVQYFAKMKGFSDNDLIINNADGYVFNKTKGEHAFLLTIKPELEASLKSTGGKLFNFFMPSLQGGK
jgi:hypothetical protein